MFNLNIFWILTVMMYLSNYNVIGFSSLRTNPSLQSSQSLSASAAAADTLQSLLANAENGIDGEDIIQQQQQQQQISNENSDRTAGAHHHQYEQQLMEHSMLSSPQSEFDKKIHHPSVTRTLLHRDNFNMPQASSSMISDDTDHPPVYDPGDELIKNYNIDERDDYMDIGAGNNDVNVNDKIGFLKKLEEEIRDEQEIVSKTALIMKMLEDPSIETLPIVYVEEPIVTSPSSSQPIDSSLEMNNYIQGVNGVEKRSRYYRRYPWKRHSSRNRGSYEADARYLCVPSKEDVFKLLVGLHENRNGNHHKTVNFCNRKRPAKTIFTNIRFLG